MLLYSGTVMRWRGVNGGELLTVVANNDMTFDLRGYPHDVAPSTPLYCCHPCLRQFSIALALDHLSTTLIPLQSRTAAVYLRKGGGRIRWRIGHRLLKERLLPGSGAYITPWLRRVCATSISQRPGFLAH